MAAARALLMTSPPDGPRDNGERIGPPGMDQVEEKMADFAGAALRVRYGKGEQVGTQIGEVLSP